MHKEVQSRLIDEGPPWNIPWTYQGFILDWMPEDDRGPFNSAPFSIEVRILSDALLGSSSDTPWAYVRGIFHCPLKSGLPRSKHGFGPIRRARDCRWQEGAFFTPFAINQKGHQPATLCYERSIHLPRKKVWQAFQTEADPAVFEILDRVWRRLFQEQYDRFCSLPSTSYPADIS